MVFIQLGSALICPKLKVLGTELKVCPARSIFVEDRAKGLSRKVSDFNRFEVGLGDAAVRAGPTLGHVSPAGAWRDAVFGATGGLVIDEAANDAKISFHESSSVD
jgi:hypothetical protein